MKPPPLRYVRPGTVAEALALLDGRSRPLAGGQSLIGLLNMRRLAVPRLVDLEAIAELRDIDASHPTDLILGAGVTLDTIERDPEVCSSAPLLREAAGLVANPQVRARSTVGGNVAHRDPVSEIVTSLAALGAKVTVRSAERERVVLVQDLVLGFEELIIDIRIPRGPADGGWAVSEVSIRHAARPLVVAAAVVELEEGVVNRSCIAIGGVGAAPVTLNCAARIRGLQPHDSEVAEAIRDAIADVGAASDPRADERYRRAVASELSSRALADAVRRATTGTAPAGGTPSAGEAPPRPGAPPAGGEPVTAEAPSAGGAPAERRHSLAVVPERDGRADVTVTVNGDVVGVRVEPRTLLCDMLRDSLGLTATHVGCEHGVCGACNVLVDGVAVRSCLLLAVQAEGREVETLEGLRDSGEIDRLVDAFATNHALQCGFCTPGFIVTLVDLRRRAVNATPEQLIGNVCRCTGYAPIVRVAAGVDEGA